MSAVLVHAASQFQIRRPDTQGPAGPFDFVFPRFAEVIRLEFQFRQRRLFDLQGPPLWQAHAIADQWTGRADFERIGPRLLGHSTLDEEARAVLVLVRQIAIPKLV